MVRNLFNKVVSTAKVNLHRMKVYDDKMEGKESCWGLFKSTFPGIRLKWRKNITETPS